MKILNIIVKHQLQVITTRKIMINRNFLSWLATESITIKHLYVKVEKYSLRKIIQETASTENSEDNVPQPPLPNRRRNSTAITINEVEKIKLIESQF